MMISRAETRLCAPKLNNKGKIGIVILQLDQDKNQIIDIND